MTDMNSTKVRIPSGLGNTLRGYAFGDETKGTQWALGNGQKEEGVAPLMTPEDNQRLPTRRVGLGWS
jgi:hypothetical protein